VSQAGGGNPKVDARVQQLGLGTWETAASPVTFWDVFGDQGHPVRATVSELGPLLFSRLLALNDIQEGVLSLVFRVADDNGLLLLDLKDLRSMLQYVADNADSLTTTYGTVAAASVGAIQRGLLALEDQGADKFFGEPALDLNDLMRVDTQGRGTINLLTADKLMMSPAVYSTFLLWLLSELFEKMPEIGDPEKPRLVFFFDEAHLLFEGAPPALLQKIEQVVRLVRSKGVGVYFVTQNPIDIPESVLGQLGNKVQHALRAFTPNDEKAVKAMAQTFRVNPKLDVEKAVTDLGVGEALISTLDASGTPGMVERAFVLPPHGHIGAITPDQRTQIISGSAVYGKYEQAVDRESAYETLKARAAASAQAAADAQAAQAAQAQAAQAQAQPAPSAPRETGAHAAEAGAAGAAAAAMFGALGTSAAHAIGSQVGRQLVRGILGGLMGSSGSSRRR
jgi:DNA helicase HerA-like ATPase